MTLRHHYLHVFSLAIGVPLALASCSGSSTSPRGDASVDSVPLFVGTSADGGIACDASSVSPGATLALGTPLPALTFAGSTGSVSVQSFAKPCATQAKLLVLRTVASWCGTCRWHASNTSTLVPPDLASSVGIVDLLLANDDNQLAAASDLASYGAHGDGRVAALADPSFTPAPFFDARPALPLYLVVDARTLTPVAALSNPTPDIVTATLRQSLSRLNGQPAPSPVVPVTYDDRFTRDQWDMIHDMKLVQPPPPDPTNRVADDPSAAALGLTLFETGKLSPQLVGCRSCHNPALLLTDGKEVPPEGTSFGTRNVPSIVLAGYRPVLSWAGVADSLWMLSVLPVELDFEYGSTRLFAAHAIFANYKAEYEAIFGPMPPLDDPTRFPATGMPGMPSWASMTLADQDAVTRVLVNMGKAIAAYLRSLRVAPSALDAYASGQLDALTSKQKDGLLAFFSAGCAQCHYGPRLSNDSFHNLRFPSGKPDHTADTGRSDGIPFYLASEFRRTGKFSDAPTSTPAIDPIVTPNLVGAFKTPDLRGVAFTLPYGHGGTYGGLTSVIEAHRTSGMPAGSTLTTGDAERFLIPFDAALTPAIVDFLSALRLDMTNPPP